MDDLEKELKSGFLEEAKQLLADAEQCFLSLETNPNNAEVIEKIFRLAHNLKGSAGAVGFTDLGHFTHHLESLLLKIKNKLITVDSAVVTLLLNCNDHLCLMVTGLQENLEATFDSGELVQRLQACVTGTSSPAPRAKAEVAAEALGALTTLKMKEAVVSAPPANPAPPPSPAPLNKPEESIRVNISKLDSLMNNVGELVILQTVLSQQKSQIASPLLQKTVTQLEKISKEIQEISMSLRMVPIKQTFQKMQRIVRDISQALNKEIILELSGEETELDKTVLEHVGDPLVHLIRNAVDHGIESDPNARVLAGKAREGRVRLSAFQSSSHIVIEVKDDGHGLDPKKLISKAIEKGLLPAGAELPDDQAYHLIFAPGFSTKSEVTDISGRGVGMDVVKTNITQLQGDIQLETVLGKGTTFRVLLPLTVAIVDGMIVRIGEERYVIPISNIHESVQPKDADIHSITQRGKVLNLRGETLPLFSLQQLLGRGSQTKLASESIAIVVRTNPKRPFSVLVDDVVAKQQVVIKKLGSEIHGMEGIAGGAILGDGRAALILDINEIVKRSEHRSRAI